MNTVSVFWMRGMSSVSVVVETIKIFFLLLETFLVWMLAKILSEEWPFSGENALCVGRINRIVFGFERDINLSVFKIFEIVSVFVSFLNLLEVWLLFIWIFSGKEFRKLASDFCSKKQFSRIQFELKFFYLLAVDYSKSIRSFKLNANWVRKNGLSEQKSESNF